MLILIGLEEPIYVINIDASSDLVGKSCPFEKAPHLLKENSKIVADAAGS